MKKKKRAASKAVFPAAFPELCVDEGTLSRLQAVLLMMLCDLDAVCRRHGLTYMMSGGTLLGAVRHGGFIPWDDDVDVLMPREDYRRLAAAMEEEFPDKYLVVPELATVTDPTSCQKIYLRGTEFREITSADRDKPQMIFLDVFCLQNAPASRLVRRLRGPLCDAALLAAILKAEYRYPSACVIERARTDPALRAFLRKRRRFGFFANLLPMRFYYFLIRRMLRKPYADSPLVHVPLGLRYSRELLPRSVFEKTIELTFAGHRFFAPCGYDAYLTNLYGRYMELPPPEKREKHVSVCIDFGPYEHEGGTAL